MFKDIWLISHSPRRQQLLRDLGFDFKVGEAHVEETYPHDLKPQDIPIYLSQLKADNANVTMTADTLVITADTIVWAEGRVLGKPDDEQEAKDMLNLLSGKTHQVITGVTLRTQERSRSFSETTCVTFATLSAEDIDYYVSNYKPLDKAGSYGIQEWIGMVGVETINGCFYNVMGLPVHRLYKEIKQISYI